MANKQTANSAVIKRKPRRKAKKWNKKQVYKTATCPICDREMPQAQNLKRHLLTHQKKAAMLEKKIALLPPSSEPNVSLTHLVRLPSQKNRDDEAADLSAPQIPLTTNSIFNKNAADFFLPNTRSTTPPAIAALRLRSNEINAIQKETVIPPSPSSSPPLPHSLPQQTPLPALQQNVGTNSAMDSLQQPSCETPPTVASLPIGPNVLSIIDASNAFDDAHVSRGRASLPRARAEPTAKEAVIPPSSSYPISKLRDPRLVAQNNVEASIAMGYIQPPPASLSPPTLSLPSALNSNGDLGDSEEAIEDNTELPPGMCGECGKLCDMRKHRMETGHGIRICSQCCILRWTQDGLVKHVHEKHRMQSVEYKTITKLFYEKEELDHFMKRFVSDLHLSQEPPLKSNSLVWSCVFHSSRMIYRDCTAFLKVTTLPDGRITVSYCSDHMHYEGDVEEETVEVPTHLDTSEMNGIQSPSSSQSPSLPQPSALAVDGVLNDTEDVLFVENVKSHRVKTEPDMSGIEDHLIQPVPSIQDASGRTVEELKALYHKEAVYVTGVAASFTLANQHLQFQKYFHQLLFGSMLEPILEKDPTDVQLMEDISNSKALPAYAESSAPGPENYQRTFQVLAMLGRISQEVTTIKETQKMLSMMEDFSSITRLGEKKAQKGDLVLKKLILGAIKKEPADRANGGDDEDDQEPCCSSNPSIRPSPTSTH